MKTLFLLFFLPVFAFAQTEIQRFEAIIQDADGFTFVRETADKNAPIIDTIYKFDVFFCEKTTGNWWKCKGTKTGWIHKSRVKALADLSLVEKKEFIKYGLKREQSNLKEYQNELAKFEKNQSTAAKIEQKRKVRHLFIEQEYGYFQNAFQEYYCEVADEMLLRDYFTTIIADKGLREQAHQALFACFMCKNAEMMAVLQTYEGENLEYLLRYLECGCTSATYESLVDKTDAERKTLSLPYQPFIKQLKTAFKRIEITSFKNETCYIP